ncbi:kinase-like domain-containing protein [Nemania sp. FL0916]|nr:kinase-like domain-containing protein [Nemania sp. FL0916]
MKRVRRVRRVKLKTLLSIFNAPEVCHAFESLAQKLPLQCTPDDVSEILAEAKIVPPDGRNQFEALKTKLENLKVTSVARDEAYDILYEFAHLYRKAELCHKLLFLNPTESDVQQRSKLVRRLSVQLYIPDDSEFAATQLQRLFEDIRRRGFSGRYLEHLTPTYFATYEKFPTNIYKPCGKDDVGKGSFGTVTQVESMSTNSLFALKTFNSGKHFDMRSDVHLNELYILQMCHHPNLLRVVDAFTVGKKELHFVTKPWAPYTLSEFLFSSDKDREGKCNWFIPKAEGSTAIIFRLMLGAASGLEFLHKHFIKHKDIKPDNILLYHKSDVNKIRPILADVGKSKTWRPGASTMFDDSTYEFLAPEQVHLKKSTLQADIWQLGCCFALLLALACNGRDATHSLWNCTQETATRKSCCISRERERFLAELQEICKDAKHVSKALPIVMRMLEEEPQRRPDIHEIVVQLRELCSGWGHEMG